jgi:hypothetical protein
VAKFPDSHPNITHQLVRPENGGGHPLSAVQAVAGTLIWTAPTGHTYTTTPGGAIFFPQLALPTGELVIPNTEPPDRDRGLMMPRRKRPREKDRQYRIAAERRINEIRIAEARRRRQAWLAANDKPPPF